MAIDGQRDGGGGVTLRLFDATKPWVAAIDGPAVGVGITLALAMDMRLASTQAKIGLVFARRGIVPEACSTWFLPRLVGVQRALEWVCAGRAFSADAALAGGLVRSVHEPGDLLPAAHALAREIASNTSGVSVAWARQIDVEDARRGPSHGCAPDRLARDPRDGGEPGRARGSVELPREAPGAALDAPESRHADVLSLVDPA